MLQCHHHHLLLPFSPRLRNPTIFSPPSLSFFHKPVTLCPLSARPGAVPELWLATVSSTIEDGPVELPPSASSIFAANDDPTPLQVTTSVLLTGAIAVFLFRSLRRRAKRAKELRFRSAGAKKTLKEEALDNLKAIGSASIESKSAPSAIQALLGGISAGVIALILYKFTTTIEAALNRQTVSDNFSVRQITITIRTIVNGLCYLATFVFGINSIGLFLYSGQLALNSMMEGTTEKETASRSAGSLGPSRSVTGSNKESTESNSSNDDQSSNSI